MEHSMKEQIISALTDATKDLVRQVYVKQEGGRLRVDLYMGPQGGDVIALARVISLALASLGVDAELHPTRTNIIMRGFRILSGVTLSEKIAEAFAVAASLNEEDSVEADDDYLDEIVALWQEMLGQRS
jgi:hypothetical protein